MTNGATGPLKRDQNRADGSDGPYGGGKIDPERGYGVTRDKAEGPYIQKTAGGKPIVIVRMQCNNCNTAYQCTVADNHMSNDEAIMTDAIMEDYNAKKENELDRISRYSCPNKNCIQQEAGVRLYEPPKPKRHDLGSSP